VLRRPDKKYQKGYKNAEFHADLNLMKKIEKKEKKVTTQPIFMIMSKKIGNGSHSNGWGTEG
jgi:hypothetical protein